MVVKCHTLFCRSKKLQMSKNKERKIIMKDEVSGKFKIICNKELPNSYITLYC